MQGLGAGVHEAPRVLQRVVRIDRLAVEVAALEPDSPAAADVDRRQQDHAARRSAPAQILVKFASRRSPWVPDFSGWNCTP